MTLAIGTTSRVAVTTSPTTPQTWAHTCDASATMLAVISVMQSSANPVPTDRETSAASYNAVSMFPAVVEGDDTNTLHVEIFALPSPAVGAADTVSIGFAGSPQADALYAVSLIDCHASPRSFGQTTGTTANPAITGITTVAGDIIIGILASDDSSGATTPGGTQIYEDEDVNTDYDYNLQYVVATGTSTDLTWTQAMSGEHWCIAYVVFKQLSGGGGGASPVVGLPQRNRRHVGRH